MPPLSGVKLKTDVSAFCVIDDFAATESLNKLFAGSADQGPVHATTTRISTMYGIQADKRLARRT